MSSFKVGDRVRHVGWGYGPVQRMSNAGAFATVVDVPRKDVYQIVYEDPAIQASWADATDDNGRLWGVHWLEAAPKPVDFTRPLKQRCGRPAEFVRIEDRDFIRVLVYLPSGPRELCYPPSGHFYKEIPSDIDLVNA